MGREAYRKTCKICKVKHTKKHPVEMLEYGELKGDGYQHWICRSCLDKRVSELHGRLV